MNTKAQRDYFDIVTHRFNEEKLLNPSPSQLLELKALESSLFLKPRATIIDFGAGNGRITLYFLKKGYNVIAVDVSARSLRALQIIYNNHKMRSWGALQTHQSLPKTHVDGIVGADILHHISIQQVLPMIISALKPSGRVAFSEPNAWHLLWYIHYFYSRIPWHIEQGILQCTYFNLKKLFQHAGLSSVFLQGHGLLPTTPLSQFQTINRFNEMMGTVWPFKLIAFRYIISGTKKSENN